MLQHIRSIRTSSGKKAFTLIELLLVVAIIALLISILLPALKEARKTARTAVCMSNMRQMAYAQQGYAQENKNLIATFNRPPTTPGFWLAEAGKQAQEIVQRNAGLTLPLVPNRYFHRNYWHLVMVDGGFLGFESSSLITPAVACPEDRIVLEWKRNSLNPAALLAGMTSDGAPGYERYRPYWSSYQTAPASWSEDKTISNNRRTVAQIRTLHHLFTEGGSTAMLPLGRRRIEEVSFPSNKVSIFDLYDRHRYRRMIWHAFPEARQPLAFFDASVRMLKTGDAQKGFEPDFPNSGVPTTYTYNSTTGWVPYDPVTPGNTTTAQVIGYYRWTKDGLRGYDYSGQKSASGN